jgi:hypothetical protein
VADNDPLVLALLLTLAVGDREVDDVHDGEGVDVGVMPHTP